MGGDPEVHLPSFLRWPGWLPVTGMAVGIGTAALLTLILNAAVAILLGIAAMFAFRAVADIWPRKIPAELADQAKRLKAAGWHRTRYHPFLCTEKRPHMHVKRPGGKGTVMVTAMDGPPAPS